MPHQHGAPVQNNVNPTTITSNNTNPTTIPSNNVNSIPIVVIVVTQTRVFAIPVDPLDPGNPYFVHSSENPSLSLVSQLLRKKLLLLVLERAMRMALLSKNKLAFVNETIKMPEKSYAGFHVWE